MQKILLFLMGSSLLIAGMTLVLKEWGWVMAFFRGTIGMVLAVAGLIILMLIKEEHDVS